MSLGFGFASTEVRAQEKILINVGCLMDIPTGSFMKGLKGETIVNGGLSQIFCIAGTGNNFKSTLLHYFMLSAADKVKEASDTYMMTYDTEINISLPRLESLSQGFKNWKDVELFRGNPAYWSVINKDDIPGEKWVASLFDYMKNKSNDKKVMITAECFPDAYTDKPTPRKVPVPTFVELDSLTELEPSSVTDMLDGDLDKSDTNTYAMKAGGFKSKFFQQLPSRCNSSNVYFLSTSHIGTSVDMGAKPWEQPTKENNFLKSNDKVKGSSGKIFFLSTTFLQAQAAKAFYNQNTKGPEYPKDPNDIEKNDLNIVQLNVLRSKSGASGIIIEVLISQTEGVLPSLSEFHFIKSNKDKEYGDVGFGIDGSNLSYHLQIYPDVNLSRTTVRSKIDNDAKLRRAIQITSDLLQLQNCKEASIKEVWCSPAELYKSIKDLGYDWNEILETRSYWTFNQYSHPVPFLSTIDLLYMRKGLYTPYWKKEKKGK